MRQLLWRVLARMLRPLRGNGVGASPEPDSGAEGRLRVVSRARFWAEFREGQREADLRIKGR
jgi:hypothetical protein